MTAATSRLIFADVPAGPVYGQAVLLCADIDLSDTISSKYDLDIVGHYARRMSSARTCHAKADSRCG
jgi:hypothetical protein